MKKIILIMALTVLAACSQAETDTYTDLTPTDLKNTMEEEDVFLVDVHVPEQQHIKGTDAVIPYDEIVDKKELLPKDKKIVLYCRSGSMSAQATQELKEAGYQNVYNLVGGANAWRSIGYEFER